MFSILDIRVAMQGDVRWSRGAARACRVTDWHDESGHCVPDELSEADWEAAGMQGLINDLMGRKVYTHGVSLRQQINGMLYRLRTRCAWEEVPAEYGTANTLKQRQASLWDTGAWPVLIGRMHERGCGSMPPPWRSLPPLAITGKLSKQLAKLDATGEAGEPAAAPWSRSRWCRSG